MRRMLMALALIVLPQAAWSQDSDTFRVERLMRRMSDEEKVGQLLMGFFSGPSLSEDLKRQISTLHPGGVILYGITGNIESPRQVGELVGSIQGFSQKLGMPPLFISIDQEGGRVSRLTEGVTVFPGNMALGATDDPLLAARQAQVMAEELRALGITMNFAPVVDVNSNPANPIIGVRSFGSDPRKVAQFGAAMLPPYRQANVIATAKHFPGHGDTEVDSHVGLPTVRRDRRQLAEIDLFPFVSLVKAGVPAVMTAHVVVPAIDPDLPSTLSPKALGILRREMRFRGLIISDSLGMGAIDQRYGMGEAAVQAFLAGSDILLFGADKGHVPGELSQMHGALLQAHIAGRISQQRLDESVRRILLAKVRYKVLDDPMPRKHYPLASPKNLDLAREISRKSLTLVRNRHLPLQKKVPLIWPLEKEAALRPILEACPYLEPVVVPMGDPSSALEVARSNEVVAIASYDLAKNPAWRDFICAMGQRALVLSMSTPYDLLQVPNAGTYVAAYGDRAPTMEALGALLLGKFTPSGILPVELPELYPRAWGMKGF